jgi:uncharacterized membrane protein
MEDFILFVCFASTMTVLLAKDKTVVHIAMAMTILSVCGNIYFLSQNAELMKLINTPVTDERVIFIFYILAVVGIVLTPVLYYKLRD